MRDNLTVVARPEGAYHSFMDKDLDWRTIPETGRDCSDAPSVVANPSAARRFSYHQDQLRVDPTYKGQLDIWSDDEKRAIFRDLLGAFMLREHQYPLPCVGLPGFPRKDYDIDEPAAELLQLGMDYLFAIFDNERRSMHFRWKEARDFIRKIESSASTDAEERMVSADAAWAEHRLLEIRNPTPQFVYFIGAASGPIKIGIAAKPKERLKGLQTGHHEKLEILAICEGGQAREREYHETFSKRRVHGEWFERCPEIEAEIERLNA